MCPHGGGFDRLETRSFRELKFRMNEHLHRARQRAARPAAAECRGAQHPPLAGKYRHDLIIIYGVGWASTNWVLASVISFGENMIGTIPFVKFIYTSVKRLSEAVLDSSSNFKRVVHVPFQGALALGFVMADLPPRFREAMGGEDYICVFIPWSLNMTSGTTLLVRAEDVVDIDISKEDALRYMLTAGAVMPFSDTKETPAQKAVQKKMEQLAVLAAAQAAEQRAAREE